MGACVHVCVHVHVVRETTKEKQIQSREGMCSVKGTGGVYLETYRS